MKRLHQCTFCNKYFSRAQNFENHQKGNLSCSKCSETFSCKTGLRNHLYKHHSVACCLCGKVCANRQQLYFHTLAHSPKFKCKYCSKGFIWESQFVVHLATHTGYKPLSCEICGKSFAHRAKLESHLRSHTGEKPFACHLCPSSFSQNCNLSAHIKSVHGIYLQSMKKGSQKITAATLLKPIKVVKKLRPPNSIEPAPLNQHLALPTHPHSIQSISVGNLRPSQMVKSTPKEQVTSVSTQLYSGEVISEPFSNGETVYQILYAYPSQ
ncbi:UNVERIFIED_CONTAM: hypothetical protein GTU68_026566 [Idotea baltica]|nr:hypothetical protein [Idotea baltica]